MKRISCASAALTFFALLAADPPAATAAPKFQPVPQSNARQLYIVQMREAPVVAYSGEVRGFAATKPAAGARLNKLDGNVTRYTDYLQSRHDAVLQKVGGARKLYSYSYALNGFSAELTEGQAAKLRATPGVVSVAPNTLLKPDTITTPGFLGLDNPNGFWDQLGGARRAGHDIIVGIVDTGIWPEHPSFADHLPGRQPHRDWAGECVAGEEFPATSCNDKLIGARWYNAGFGGDETTKLFFPYEFMSPRAAEGHGVHTAGTAVGNHRVPVDLNGNRIGRASGMAPGARLAVYKACWGFGGDPLAGCQTVDTVAAIDQAVADGVDVINFSISGSTTSFISPVEVAFLFAAEAGVFVAASAGNAGPGPSTVAHNSPWAMTVAAGTHDRRFDGTVRLGDGSSFLGRAIGTAAASSPIVLSSTVGLAGQDPTAVRLCFPGTLDPALVTGKIVVCDRGVNARVEKSQVVGDAGGVGMILANVTPGTLNADIHSVPTVHVDEVAGASIKAYVSGIAGPTASLSRGVATTGPETPATNVANFSSHGPALAGGGDLLKPDIIAPGVDVLAATSPVATGNDWEFLSGTSMSSPHIAGLAALMKDRHPRWSPAAIKSALMTTAVPRRNDGTAILEEGTTTEANAFGYGAGQVNPNRAMDPGLVYDADMQDWIAFLCGTGSVCLEPGVTADPSDLNYPSIAIGALPGKQTVRRTVTNVSHHWSTYVAAVKAPPGVKVDVSPRFFVIAPGKSKTYTVTFTNESAPLNAYAHGSITWLDGRHSVRSPIAVRPVALGAPAEVSSTGGSVSYPVTFGFAGAFGAQGRGLVPAETAAASVVDDPANDINTALGTGVGITIVPVTVPAGSTFARFALFDADTDGEDDLDLYVFNSAGAFVGSSGSTTSAESVSLANPVADTYLVVVHGWQTDGPDANFTLYSWAVGATDAGNMTVTAPATATLGGTANISLSFTGLAPGVKYLGSVAYSGAAGLPAPTIVSVDPAGSVSIVDESNPPSVFK